MTAQATGYQVDISTYGRTHILTCDALGLREEYQGTYTAALAAGRRMVERHLREHGPVPVERPGLTQEERDEVFGGY